MTTNPEHVSPDATTYVHLHASKSTKPTRLPSNHEWFIRSADFWVGETVQDQGQEIIFCWTREEQKQNPRLYADIKHQLFMLTLNPVHFNKKYKYVGHVVFDRKELFAPYYIIFSCGDTQALEDEVDEYDSKLAADGGQDSYGIYTDLDDFKLVRFVDDRVLF